MNDLEDIRRELEREKGRRDQIRAQVTDLDTRIAENTARIHDHEQAQGIVQAVAQATQEKLEYHISEIVSLALSTVFPDPYRLNVDFELRRGQSEADITFSKDGGEKISPLSASGGGAVDVAAFGLRISLWSLRRPKTRAVMVLDEPFRFVSRDLQPRASAMIKEISERLGLQFIIVTHEPNLLESADRIFEVTIKNRVSEVKEI